MANRRLFLLCMDGHWFRVDPVSSCRCPLDGWSPLDDEQAAATIEVLRDGDLHIDALPAAGVADAGEIAMVVDADVDLPELFTVDGRRGSLRLPDGREVDVDALALPDLPTVLAAVTDRSDRWWHDVQERATFAAQRQLTAEDLPAAIRWLEVSRTVAERGAIRRDLTFAPRSFNLASLLRFRGGADCGVPSDDELASWAAAWISSTGATPAGARWTAHLWAAGARPPALSLDQLVFWRRVKHTIRPFLTLDLPGAMAAWVPLWEVLP